MLTEQIQQLESILQMELKDIQLLNPEKTTKIKNLLGLVEDPKVFYNSTNIILTDADEYSKLKTVAKVEEVLELKMSQFNMYLFISNYINSPQIKAIIEE